MRELYNTDSHTSQGNSHRIHKYDIDQQLLFRVS